jgi:nitrous oxidase accessory protein NosD
MYTEDIVISENAVSSNCTQFLLEYSRLLVLGEGQTAEANEKTQILLKLAHTYTLNRF